MPKRFQQIRCEPPFPSGPKEFYRRLYFEAVNFAVERKEDSTGFKTYSNLEQLLKASSGENYDDELNLFCNFFGDDFCREDLEAQLKTFRQLILAKIEEEERPSIASLKRILLTLSPGQRNILNIVCRAFHLLLVMQATNSTSERSFRALAKTN